MHYIGTVINKKNKKFYIITELVINTTNAQNDQVMVYYVSLYGNKYVREINEFKEKFDLNVSERCSMRLMPDDIKALIHKITLKQKLTIPFEEMNLHINMCSRCKYLYDSQLNT